MSIHWQKSNHRLLNRGQKSGEQWMRCYLYVILELFLQAFQGNTLTLAYYSGKQPYIFLFLKLILELLFS